MAGVRIQHGKVRNARFTIVENDRPYPAPYTCTSPEFGGCGSVHLFKTHHLNVDETRACIVGDELYARIKRLLVANGFRETNLVEKPPTLVIFGIPSAVGESVRDRYELDYPDQQYWDSVKVFARFPQGISDIDLTTIKPVFNLNESE